MNTSTPTVVILGGGPAGLCAAWRLATAPNPPRIIVFEAEAQPGGLCMTVEDEGFRFDLGGHRFISRTEALVEQVKGLLGDDLLVRQRTSRILLGGRTYHYPLEALNLLKTLPPGVAFKAALDLFTTTVRRAFVEPISITFDQWTRSRFGDTLSDLFFKPYTEKLWGIPTTRLSADWASQRISLLNLADAGLHLCGLGGGVPRTYAREFYYPKYGIGQLFEVLVEELTRLGVDFRPQQKVTDITMSGHQCVGVSTDGRADHIPCDWVISTIPLASLALHIAPGAKDIQESAARLKSRGLRFLNVKLKGDPLLDATWIYVSEGKYAMTRIQEPMQRSPFMAPKGHTGVMFEVPCDRGEPLWDMGDAQLYERIADDMHDLGFPIRGRTVGYFSTYAPHAYPIYDLGYGAHRNRLLDVVGSTENIWTLGRQGLFRYVFMDTAMEMGWKAAGEWLGAERPNPRSMMALDQNGILQEIQATTA